MIRRTGLALFVALASSMGCSGGQSFDDGTDPIGIADEHDGGAGMTPDPAPANDTEAPRPLTGADDAGAGGASTLPPARGGEAGATEPMSSLSGAAGGESSTVAGAGGTASEEPTGSAGSNEEVPSPAGAAGAVPMTTGGQGGDAPTADPGTSESAGVVELTFSAEEPERYCQSSNGAISVRIEDAEGNVFGVGTTLDSCGVVPCETCVRNPDCVITDVYYPNVYGAGGTVYWDGLAATNSSCEAGGATLSCVPPTYAAPGTYTAVYCAPLGVPSDVPPNECSFVGTGQECVRVEFDYPGDSTVSAEVPAGGIDEAELTFVCGGTRACSLVAEYCSTAVDEPYHCAAFPDECVEDRSCDCLEQNSATEVRCSENTTDGSLLVAE